MGMTMGMCVGDIVRSHARHYPNLTAVVHGDLRHTWKELDQRTNRLANGLLKLGLRKGDRLAILSPNTLHYWELFFGLGKSGIIGVPLNVRLHVHELRDYLRYTGPRALVASPRLLDTAEQLMADVPSLEHLIVLPGGDRGLGYEEVLASGAADDVPVSLAVDDLYMLCATSGTTGTAKAAMMTHHNAVQGILLYLAEGINVQPGNAALQVIPMYFNAGGPAQMYQFGKAGTGVILEEFSPSNFLQAVQEHRITHTILVPTMLNMIVNHPEVERYDVSSIRCIIMGGSPLPAPLLRRGREIFGDVFFPRYGMTETYSLGLLLDRQDQHSDGPERLTRRLKSAGKPEPGMECRVVNEQGEDVAWGSGEAGEILLRGPTVCRGYWNLPEETANALRDGWMHTGDMATVDEDGYIYIVDRKKDIIITGGINVYSVEIEQVIATHPAVSMVAVIGVPDEQWGEAIQACVVLKPGQTTTEEEIIRWCRDRLASYKKPKYVQFLTDMPLSGTGKILKRVLRERYWAGLDRKI